MPTKFKELLATDQLIPLFALGRLVDPIILEMVGIAGGYRGFWLDIEHAQISTNEITAATIAGRANGLDNFVRMAPTGYAPVTQCLEAGAGGVMAAMIHNVDQAREFTSWAKFPPVGIRGLNSGGRDANYTHKPLSQFVEDANRDTFVAIQVETLGALEQADEIAGLDGVDILFVGPSDLSMAVGVVGQFHHEKLWDAIKAVAAACHKHGKTWGCVAPDPQFAQQAIDLGCRMPTFGNEVHAIRRGIAAIQEGFQGFLGS